MESRWEDGRDAVQLGEWAEKESWCSVWVQGIVFRFWHFRNPPSDVEISFLEHASERGTMFSKQKRQDCCFETFTELSKRCCVDDWILDWNPMIAQCDRCCDPPLQSASQPRSQPCVCLVTCTSTSWCHVEAIQDFSVEPLALSLKCFHSLDELQLGYWRKGLGVAEDVGGVKPQWMVLDKRFVLKYCSNNGDLSDVKHT